MRNKNLIEYSKELNLALNKTSEEDLLKVFEILKQYMNGEGEIHIFGNGGSAANAHHIVGDFTKTFTLLKQSLKINTISDNGCYVSAVSNDIDFGEIFSLLIPHRVKKNDLIIFLSGSGNSANLVKCAYKAKKYGIKTISFTGYDGGRLYDLADIAVNFPVKDMEIAEDCQLISFHYLKQKLCSYFEEKGFANVLDSDKYTKRILNGEVV